MSKREGPSSRPFPRPAPDPRRVDGKVAGAENPCVLCHRGAAPTEFAEYVSLERAAELLGVAKNTLYNRICTGKARELDAAKVLGRWRIRSPRSARSTRAATGKPRALSGP